MAKFCRGCNQFKGTVKTCLHCGLPFCSDCRASSNICKDCFLIKNESKVIGEYYNEKKHFVIVNTV